MLMTHMECAGKAKRRQRTPYAFLPYAMKYLNFKTPLHVVHSARSGFTNRCFNH